MIHWFILGLSLCTVLLALVVVFVEVMDVSRSNYAQKTIYEEIIKVRLDVKRLLSEPGRPYTEAMKKALKNQKGLGKGIGSIITETGVEDAFIPVKDI